MEIAVLSGKGGTGKSGPAPGRLPRRGKKVGPGPAGGGQGGALQQAAAGQQTGHRVLSALISGARFSARQNGIPFDMS